MSYTIVFETKIALCPNGDVIHFERRGCNNDTEGRRKDEFCAALYSTEEWEREIRKWETMEDGGFELKIGSRPCSFPEYGRHLRRMTKKAKPLTDLMSERQVSGTVFDGIKYFPEEGNPVVVTDEKEINEIFYGLLYGEKKGFYRRMTHRISSAAEIENSIRNRERCEFFIGRRR